MSELNDFYLDSTPSSGLIECVEISHSLWPQPLRYVTNHAFGVTVKHENGVTTAYEFMPLQLQKGASSNDLDRTLSITVSDLGEVVPQLLKIIRDANSIERPRVIMRSYSSANLNAPFSIEDGLEVEDRTSNHEATTFKAATKRANSTGTGMLYTVENFPSLRGFF